MENPSLPIKKPDWRIWVVFFALFIIAFVAVGLVFLNQETARIRQEKHQDLSAIGALKAQQLVQWRKERLADAKRAVGSPFFERALKDWLKDPQNPELTRQWHSSLVLDMESYGYSDSLLVDLSGNILLSASENPHPLHREVLVALEKALAENNPVISEIYLCSNGIAHIDTVILPKDSAGNPLPLAQILRFDAESFLYPLLRSWPTSSQSAETLLVRRENDSVLFLNPLRHWPEAALVLRIPIEQADLPAVHAVMGKTGIFQGRDYRGVEVLSDLRPVEGSNWFLVTKVDSKEILAPIRYLAWAFGVFMFFGVLLAALGAEYLFRQRQVQNLKDLYLAEREKRRVQEQLEATLYSIGDAVLATDEKGLVKRMNPVAERLTGWSQEEAFGRPVDEIFVIISEHSRDQVENPVARVLREGQVVGLANHTMLIAKDGREIPITDSGAPIRIEGDKIEGVVLVFRDQTQERKAIKAIEESEARVRAKLNAILEPDSSLESLELGDILDAGEIQSVMDNFYALTNMGVAIIDLNGKLLVAAGWQDICTKFHRVNPQTNKACIESDCELSQGVEKGQYKLYKCKNNLWELSTPIFVGNRKLGNIFFGQFFFDDDEVDRDFFRQQAKKFGFDEEKYLDALDSVPRWPRKSVDALMGFYARFAEMISRLAYSNLALARTLTERDGLFGKLETNKAFLDALLEAMPLPVFYKDRDGRYLGMNKAFEDFFGQTREQLKGKTAFDIAPKDLATTYQQKDEELFESAGIQIYESRVSNASGQMRDVVFHKAAIADADGRATSLVGAIMDITDRKRAQEQLKKSEAQYRLIADNSADIISIQDKELNFTYVSPSVERIRGYTAEECYRQTLDQVMTPTSLEYAMQVFEEETALEAQGHADPTRTRTLELEEYKKDGSTIWVEAVFSYIRNSRGEFTGILSVSRETTDRKAAQKALQESEHKHRLLAENTLDAIWQMDTDLKFTYVNQASARYGYSPDEWTGTYLHEHCTPENMEFMAQAVAKAIEDNAQSVMFETELLHRDGTPIPVEIHGKLLRDEKGDPLWIQGTTRDISARKKAEEDHKKLEAQLRQAQKMEAVGQLAGGIAHDFNNMLGVVIGYSELALMGLDESSTLHRYVTEIKGAGKRSAQLVDRLLAFARKQTITPSVLDLNSTISGMFKMLGRLIGENIQLFWKPDAGICPVYMDPSQIDQIITNLVVNARDAISDVGSVTIQTAVVKVEEYPQFGAENTVASGKFVMLSVSDTGLGMDKKTQENIFEPFFTTKEVGKGTGLGLATVYGIVRQNNGFIKVYSEPGQGSAFKIFLPCYDDGQSLTKGLDKESLEPPKGMETILLVEDEDSLLDLTKQVLTQLDYKVLAVNSPQKAIDLAKTYKSDIHLLLTDVVMPHMNGLTLWQHLQALRPEMKSLFMSGYSAEIISHKGVLDKGLIFLEKPFSRLTLAEKVREALESKDLMRQ
jgi:PAS domain S-box-containing protein